MTSLTRLIAAALISASVIAPALAFAEDRQGRLEGREDRDERFERRDRDARPAPPAAAPAWATRDDLRWDGRGWFPAGWGREPQGPRFAQARAVRFELARLERDRAAFHVRFVYQPRRLAAYDAWYYQECAALERQLQALTWYARR